LRALEPGAGIMWDKALELASRITHPISIAAFSLVVSAFLFTLALKRTGRGSSRKFYAVLAVIFLLGLAPLLASTYLQSRGVYRLRVEVLQPDGRPVSDAEVSSMPGGEIKKASMIWEIDIPPQVLPADRKVTVRATVQQDFLSGEIELPLTTDYFPTGTIKLKPDPPVLVRGVVVDARGKPVPGATVAIPGFGETATTNEMGNFVIASRMASSQRVSVTAKKGALTGTNSGLAGDVIQVTINK